MTLTIAFAHPVAPFARWVIGAQGSPPSETMCTLHLSSDLTVWYSDGSSDTLPALTPATDPLGVTTTFDRTTLTWIGYTVKGSGVLSILPESNLSNLGGTVGLLCRVTRTTVDPWGAIQTGTLAPAAEGHGDLGPGASAGGQASVAGTLEFVIDNGGPGSTATIKSCWFLLDALPGGDTIFDDFALVTSQYVRLVVQSDGLLRYEVSCGGTFSAVINTGHALVPNVWYWISYSTIVDSNRLKLYFRQYRALVLEVDWTGIFAFDIGDNGGITYSAATTYGWGANTSAGGYAEAPDTWQRDVDSIENQTSGGHSPPEVWSPPPAADPSPVGQALYLCHQAIGATSILNDSSGNGNDLNGSIVIYNTGPY